jgi:NAD(P)-dependent dehydrogenase (short-subunit alcohol dehydrogenase family)
MSESIAPTSRASSADRTTPSSVTRVALVTGANRGIGLETSRQLAREGVLVLMAGRDERSIHAAADTLRAEGLSVEPVVLDITDAGRVQALRADLERRFGRLDVLVNNAGVILEGGFFQNNAPTIAHDVLARTFEVNLFATVALTQALLPLIVAAPAGRIVNLSSILGSLGVHSQPDSPLKGLAPLAYDASKAALNVFTIHLAAALADTKVLVNSAHPGWVKTELGTDAAPMEVVDGARTSVELALLPEGGPTGKFLHLGQEIPW